MDSRFTVDTKNLNNPKPASKLNIKYTDGLIESEKPTEIDKNTYQSKVIGVIPGDQQVSASYYNSKSTNRTVTVREEMASLLNVIPSNFVISQGDSVNLILRFDKAMPLSQQPPKIILSDNLTLLSDFMLNPDRKGGFITVMGSNVGRGISKCYFGGIKKEIESLTVVKDEENNIYQILKTDLSISDKLVIYDYFRDNHKIAKNHDIVVIKVKENDTLFAVRTYIYSNNDWINANGTEQASNIILDDNIILAGEYTNVGNLTKGRDGEILNVKGMSVLEIFKMMFTKRILPKILKYPKIINFKHEQLDYIEFGEFLGNISYGATSEFIQGEYSYDQTSNVEILQYEVSRITNINKSLINTTSLKGSDPLSGQLTEELKFIQYEAKISYDKDTTQLKDNMGSFTVEDNLNIPAGICTSLSKKIQGYRKMFMGGLTTDISNDSIRNELSHANNNLIPNSFYINVKSGSKYIVIAFPKDTHTIKKITNITIMQTDVTDIFIKTKMDISGANRYHPIEYDIYYYKPANPFKYDTELLVELGGDSHE